MDESGPETVRDDDPAAPSLPEMPPPPWRLARSRSRRLRLLFHGKYLPLCVIVLVFAALGAFIGYQRFELLYLSDGMVKIEPKLPRILYALEENTGAMPMFSDYVACHMELMRSPRVIEAAMASEKWRSAAESPDPYGDSHAQFLRKLVVCPGTSTSVIHVSYIDPDPAVAQAAVESVIDAYMNISGERDAKQAHQRLRLLNDRQANLQFKIDGHHSRIRAIAEGHIPYALEEKYKSRLRESHKLESKLMACQVELAARGAETIDQYKAEAKRQSKVREPAPVIERTVEEIAEADPEMRMLLGRKEALAAQLETMRQRGLGSRHRDVGAVARSLKLVDAEIKARTARLNAEGARPSGKRSGADAAAVGRQAVEMLRGQTMRLQRLCDRTRAETLELAQRIVEIEKLSREGRRHRRLLEETRDRIERTDDYSLRSLRLPDAGSR